MALPRPTDDQTDEEFAVTQAEHREHHDDIVMDCSLCLDEWQAITGRPWGEA